MEDINDKELVNYYCEEEDLLEELDDEFSFQIKERGIDYYKSGNVILCLKDNNKYFAKVKGSNNEPYKVNIEITEDDILCDCSCPCDFPCKHEYAVLIAISNQEYTNIKLKPEVKEKKENLQNILKDIPAEDLKEYLLSSKGMNYVCFEMNSFEEYFKKYYPSQSYEYYYNNLYNALVLDNEYEKVIDSYINKIRQYISNLEYEEGFKILKSIIEAYNDSNKLNFDSYIINQFPTLGMLFRIINRKCNKHLKDYINSYILELKKNNYYNNLYLEDIIMMINFK
ncbi:MAG: SWIM zinc finger family protein [Tenericutes bacterium]|nr:SWIM zinc finger family protein [Mycoplasmatota bacterium]